MVVDILDSILLSFKFYESDSLPAIDSNKLSWIAKKKKIVLKNVCLVDFFQLFISKVCFEKTYKWRIMMMLSSKAITSSYKYFIYFTNLLKISCYLLTKLNFCLIFKYKKAIFLQKR